MKQFKKRTLALVLASVVTVVGSFAAESYKNSLMGLSFESDSSGAINMILETKTSYAGSVSPIKRDENTYILTLPEVNSLAPTPDLQEAPGNIESVSIRTMPYSSYGNGYTRITIKTVSSINLLGKNRVYVPTEKKEVKSIAEKAPKKQTAEKKYSDFQQVDEFSTFKSRKVYEPESTPETQNIEQTVKISAESTKGETSQNYEEVYEDVYENNTSHEKSLLLLGILLVIACSAYCYVKAKNKLTEIVGEKLDIDVSDDTPKVSTNKKIKKIRDTVKTLDAAYSKTAMSSINNNYKEPIKTKKPAEELNIVDLDKIFQEQVNAKSRSEQDENDALEDFLSGFSFYEEEVIEEQPKGSFDEEAFEAAINNPSLHFSKNDIDCINKLLNAEISDDTLRNIDSYLVSNPISTTTSKQKILEDLVTDYAVYQNVYFSQDDIKTLYQLINVELDSDFITDLRTNPDLTKQMEAEIRKFNSELRKPSEIITLNVKNMLPNLTEELKKQGGKKIESNYKPQAIYFKEGYDVSKITPQGELPNLSVEINNKNSYKFKPSAEVELMDNSYDVAELKIADQLPDLKTALMLSDGALKDAVVNEKALLDNLTNVKFKPFDDGMADSKDKGEMLTINDIQQEFNNIGNISVHLEEEVKSFVVENDDFTSLYSNEFIDLDSKKEAELLLEMPNSKKTSQSKASEDILRKIVQTNAEREEKRRDLSSNSVERKTSLKTPTRETFKCIVGEQSYSIVSSVDFSNNMGCHLAKNENGYVILSYVGDTVRKIKSFESLKSEKIQARLSESLTDGTKRYLVRIGINKFVIDVKDRNINYVMDLC